MSNYPPRMTLRPIDAWPRPETRNRQRSQFSANWSATLDLLDRETFHLGNGRRHPDTVLQIALRERDFRISDGMPRANAVPSHPGVILSIESAKGPLSFPCDKFDRWQDNLRAIALGLEALRKVDRYGITPGDEQYQGWRAIEAKPAKGFPNAAEALVFLASVDSRAHHPPAPADAAAIYRRARAEAHPDRNSGARELWDRVEAAADRLRAAGWLA
ncbi:molecular chaperone DnaJ [Mycolicibacterium fortuitum]|uniref:Molecular chaperone DnaJ n=1 Tax=Mycolicibacterium fortuitum TaxID=1766 RepID=A0ABD6QP48_MYCFO|nr:molecular chaperone DnaJ [Mycolicibacterium fortuitum]OMC46872.1 molecular chaperone DnaJ [Mycolicibacterium fortuitum]